jgi:rfaE bifunctional protein nucleotidyltransferase chain/domain
MFLPTPEIGLPPISDSFKYRGLGLNTASKIIDRVHLPAWREAQRTAGKTLVVTNGCFDLLHAGHVTYLEAARSQGDVLLIGLNSDESVRQLKGPSRPVNDEADRARVLAALECVDAVCLFPEVRAVRFLSLAQPDVYVKGGDYTAATLNPEERGIVESAGGRIVILPLVPCKSTTALFKKISRL